MSHASLDSIVVVPAASSGLTQEGDTPFERAMRESAREALKERDQCCWFGEKSVWRLVLAVTLLVLNIGALVFVVITMAKPKEEDERRVFRPHPCSRPKKNYKQLPVRVFF
jgi:hypothetical protein